MKLIKYLIILIILFVLVIIFTPLKLYYPHISQQLRPVQLQNISGSAVKGSAESVNYIGMNLGSLSWLTYPSSYNELTVDFNLESPQYDFHGKLSQTPSAQILKDFRGTMDWKQIEKFVNVKYGEISGYFDFNFQTIEIRDEKIHKIIGKATSKELKIIKPIQKDIGEIEIDFSTDTPAIIAGVVNSKSNVINVSGAVYIHKNHRWEVKLTLIPMPGEYEIEYLLQGIGEKRPGGGRMLNLAGFY